MSDIRRRLKRFISQMLAGLIAFMQFAVFMPVEAVKAASANLVISQIQTSGSSATDEFIELYNKSSSAISLNGWSLQYKGGSSSAFPSAVTNQINFGATATVPANGYFLVVNTGASAGLISKKDVTSSNISLSGTGATVFLVNGTTALTSDSDASIVDKVAYGTGTLYAETAATSAPSANGSIERKPGNFNGTTQDTDDNSADFRTLTTADPRNSLSAITPSAPASAPTLAVPTAGDAQVALSWSAITDATDYVIYQDGSVLSGSVTGTTKLVTGLTNGVTYSFQVVARNMYGTEGPKSVAQLATPIPAVVVTPDPLEAAVVYKRNTLAATSFGAETVTVEVTLTSGSLTAANKPLKLVVTRPNTTPMTVSLTNSSGNVWTGSFAVAKGTTSQDGTVTSQLLTNDESSVTITSGNSFVVDTNVSAPTVSVTSRCSTQEDSFTATTDNDVTLVYVSTSPSFTLANLSGLVLVASANSGTVTESYVGDNLFGTLYAYAKDSLGNLSIGTAFVNDIVAPVVPTIQAEAGDRVVTISWNNISDAKDYVFRYRKSGDTNWTQSTVTTTSQNVAVDNGVNYEFAVASRDTYCNQSAFAAIITKGVTPAQVQSSGRGGIASQEAAVIARSIAIAEEKDGEALTFKSPYSTDEDKDQNGIKDADEDKDGNGIKDGEDKDGNGIKDAEEDKNNNGIKDSEENNTAKVNDRSRLIIAVAILLIIAGAAIAAYSWAQGDSTNGASAVTPVVAKDGDKKEEKTEAAAEAPAEKKTAKRGKSKRKTRW